MTITDVLSGQSVGTSTNVGTKLFASKVTLNAATSGLLVSAQLTAGAGLKLDPKQRLRVWLISSPFDVVAAAAPNQFEKAAEATELNVPSDPSGLMITNSAFQVNFGGFAYIWLEVPALTVAASLNLKLVEV